MIFKKPVVSMIKKLRKFRKNFNKPNIEEIQFKKCPKCKELNTGDQLLENVYTCFQCNYHFNMGAKSRIKTLLDDYIILNTSFKFKNPIEFPDYEKKHKKTRKDTGLEEAIITAEGKLYDINVLVVALDNSFFMGSLGTYMGSELCKSFKYARKKKLPIIVFSTSGGARMQEGIFSLMQMARTSMEIKKHSEEPNLYISYMTNPTTGGVTASFASLGDINLSEPGALIGFAGPRVIKETMGTELPEEFQTAEFLLDKGFLDDVIDRKHMKDYLYKLVKLHGYGGAL